jgi:hypothetical protein
METATQATMSLAEAEKALRAARSVEDVEKNFQTLFKIDIGQMDAIEPEEERSCKNCKK